MIDNEEEDELNDIGPLKASPSERYHNMDNGEILKVMQRRLFEELLDRVESGTATHQELAIVAKLMNDQGLVMPPQDPHEEEADRTRKEEDLPEFGKPEYA